MLINSELVSIVERYAAGPAVLRHALRGLSAEQMRQAAAPGRWSVLEVLCHLADFEIVYADRMKRVLAEHEPTMFGGDPDQFALRLAYDQRQPDEELAVIVAVRSQMVRLLNSLDDAAFERIGKHSQDGPLTLRELLRRIAGHVPHHTKFIEGKRTALGAEATL